MREFSAKWSVIVMGKMLLYHNLLICVGIVSRDQRKVAERAKQTKRSSDRLVFFSKGPSFSREKSQHQQRNRGADFCFRGEEKDRAPVQWCVERAVNSRVYSLMDCLHVRRSSKYFSVNKFNLELFKLVLRKFTLGRSVWQPKT